MISISESERIVAGKRFDLWQSPDTLSKILSYMLGTMLSGVNITRFSDVNDPSWSPFQTLSRPLCMVNKDPDLAIEISLSHEHTDIIYSTHVLLGTLQQTRWSYYRRPTELIARNRSL